MPLLTEGVVGQTKKIFCTVLVQVKAVSELWLAS